MNHLEQTSKWNLLSAGCCGCHIVDKDCPWIFDVIDADSNTRCLEAANQIEDNSEDDEEEKFVFWYMDVEQHVENINADPEPGGSGIFCVVNVASHTRTAYVSLSADSPESLIVTDKNGRQLQVGFSKGCRTADKTPCITFVLVLPAKSGIRLSRISLHNWEAASFQVFRMSFELKSPSYLSNPNPFLSSKGKPVALARLPQFPLSGGPWLCTQGVGGRLTHFFPESLYAIDLRCSAGTPLLAVADGVIIEVEQLETSTGIHATNLWSWNAVSLGIDVEGFDEGLVVDYVHILANSCRYQKGDKVKAGDVICLSGAVGFAPEPHVHLEMHRQSDPQGSSIPFAFISKLSSREDFTPIAGIWYDENGKVAF